LKEETKFKEEGNGSSLFCVYNHHKIQHGLESKFILPMDNDEEPKELKEKNVHEIPEFQAQKMKVQEHFHAK